MTDKQRTFGRSLGDFADLSDKEKEVVAAARAGRTAEIGNQVPQTESDDNRIRATLVRFLAVGGDDANPIHERGVRIAGAYIVGDLDLEGCLLLGRLELTNCNLAGSLRLQDARTRTLELNGSRCRDISGDRLDVDGSVLLRNGFVATGAVRLFGAKIAGALDCDGGRFEGQDEAGCALLCGGVEIGRSALLRNGFVAAGTVRFLAAKINGNLACDGGEFSCREGVENALDCGSSVIGGSVLLRDGFVATTGAVCLLGAKIAGALDCSGGRFEGQDRDGDALPCDRAEIGRSALLNNGFVATGAVRFFAARINGNLSCADGKFSCREGVENALHCESSLIGGSVLLRHGFVAATGAVRLLGAKIAGALDCDGGRFEGQDRDGDALVCDQAEIGRSALLRHGFVATKGSVRLFGAKIDGNLNCSGGRLEGRDKNGVALLGTRIHVGDDVRLADGFLANGCVQLLGATIGGDVECHGGTFGAFPTASASEEPKSSSRGSERPPATALDLDRAAVAGTLLLSRATFHGGLDLTGAHIRRLVDVATPVTKPRAPDASAAGGGASPAFLILDGLIYDRFGSPTDLSSPARIALLRLQREGDLGGEFKPQPWTQMVKTLRETGHPNAARDVAIAFEDQRRRAGKIRGLAVPLYWLYGVLVGYGHRPLRLFTIVIAVWLACGALYHYAAVQGTFGPSQPAVFQNPAYAPCRPDYRRTDSNPELGNWYWCNLLKEEYSTFNPYLYSLDLILPVVDLQQEKDWAPIIPTPRAHDASHHWLSNYVLDVFAVADWRFAHFVRFAVWFEILFGWAASLMLAAVLSGLAKRME